jgi:hypothetical protein
MNDKLVGMLKEKTPVAYFKAYVLLLLSVGLAEFRLMHCGLPRLIVLTPLFLVTLFTSRGAPRQTT